MTPPQLVIEQKQARAVDKEREDRAGDRPDRELKWRQLNAEAGHRALDQEDRGNSKKNILAEKQADIVRRSRDRLDVLDRLLVELAVLLFGCRECHWRDERTHR